MSIPGTAASTGVARRSSRPGALVPTRMIRPSISSCGTSPTNTFHVGFWFDNPNDAKACGFDPTKPTPFNGQHNAGPNAMISVPNATTGLGPLCLNPNTSTFPATCNP